MEPEEFVRLKTPQEQIEDLLIKAEFHALEARNYHAIAMNEKQKAEKCVAEIRKIRRENGL